MQNTGDLVDQKPSCTVLPLGTFFLPSANVGLSQAKYRPSSPDLPEFFTRATHTVEGRLQHNANQQHDIWSLRVSVFCTLLSEQTLLDVQGACSKAAAADPATAHVACAFALISGGPLACALPKAEKQRDR